MRQKGEPQRGFDVGNGLISVGDLVTVYGHRGEIKDVLEDGEAEIEFFDGRGGLHIVKWRFIFPAR